MTTFTERTFGIEIEFVGLCRYEAERVINARGVDCRNEHYNHTTQTYWKIVTDASLRAVNGHAYELVSPILRGDAGVAELKTVLEAINEAGAQVNVSCGLHVHLGCQDLSMNEIATIYERYAAYESQIDSVMPRSRRGNARWARSLAGMTERVKGCADKHEAEWFDRYYKINLSNVARRGAMEFRQHSGTTDFTKISNWLAFLQQFIERSVVLANSGSPEAPTFRPRKSRAFDHARRIAEHFNVTVAWIGQRYVFSRDDRVLGRMAPELMESFYRTGAHDSLDVAEWMHALGRMGALPTMELDGDWLDGVESEVRNYLNERQQDLA